jgi:hypothetical protein
VVVKERIAMRMFQRVIAIAYSGAEVADSSLKSQCVFVAEGDAGPVELRTLNPMRRYWSRREIAEWLIDRIHDGIPTLIGIDHAFSFPLRYFQRYRLAPNWPDFLDDFQAHWPTDARNTYVDFVRDGNCGAGALRSGSARWRRHTEALVPGMRSVFQFDGAGANAKAAHAGVPFLRHIRKACGNYAYFWPFDGWSPPPGKSVIAETHPGLWRNELPRGAHTYHQHAAFVVAATLSNMDRANKLSALFAPAVTERIRREAQLEGWVFGALPAVAPPKSAHSTQTKH